MATDYPEFRDNRLQRVVTKRYEEIISNLEELQNMRTPWPFYLDTEGGYQNFPNGTNVALISIYNARDHEVLLLRVHELSRDEFGEVKRIINSMARRFVTFGNEDDVIVGPLANMQLEYGNDGRLRQPRTLRAHAEDIQFNLRKCETMSNWASAELREDQLQYAAMDSIVLHYLNIGAPLNWTFDLPRPIGIHLLPHSSITLLTTPSTTAHHNSESIHLLPHSSITLLTTPSTTAHHNSESIHFLPHSSITLLTTPSTTAHHNSEKNLYNGKNVYESTEVREIAPDSYHTAVIQIRLSGVQCSCDVLDFNRSRILVWIVLASVTGKGLA
ncbi:hypothetical protein GCK72_011450 [Caenorhabditis remanei]|uniref:3'-5' exonuclease domain-containing protein n=1 Tax=Caenorhabditis remanei TaxID=31234 RepID=A0A6A5H8R5_CAERE|nr:hypothetical protein GCK72_011450 [Caenorhabditis remanei]KAF1763184.1 hypothetical protein GCK72_011450 [Caenorhabditis remanei]